MTCVCVCVCEMSINTMINDKLFHLIIAKCIWYLKINILDRIKICFKVYY